MKSILLSISFAILCLQPTPSSSIPVNNNRRKSPIPIPKNLIIPNINSLQINDNENDASRVDRSRSSASSLSDSVMSLTSTDSLGMSLEDEPNTNVDKENTSDMERIPDNVLLEIVKRIPDPRSLSSFASVSRPVKSLIGDNRPILIHHYRKMIRYYLNTNELQWNGVLGGMDMLQTVEQVLSNSPIQSQSQSNAKSATSTTNNNLNTNTSPLVSAWMRVAKECSQPDLIGAKRLIPTEKIQKPQELRRGFRLTFDLALDDHHDDWKRLQAHSHHQQQQSLYGGSSSRPIPELDEDEAHDFLYSSGASVGSARLLSASSPMAIRNNNNNNNNRHRSPFTYSPYNGNPYMDSSVPPSPPTASSLLGLSPSRRFSLDIPPFSLPPSATTTTSSSSTHNSHHDHSHLTPFLSVRLGKTYLNMGISSKGHLHAEQVGSTHLSANRQLNNTALESFFKDHNGKGTVTLVLEITYPTAPLFPDQNQLEAAATWTLYLGNRYFNTTTEKQTVSVDKDFGPLLMGTWTRSSTAADGGLSHLDIASLKVGGFVDFNQYKKSEYDMGLFTNANTCRYDPSTESRSNRLEENDVNEDGDEESDSTASHTGCAEVKIRNVLLFSSSEKSKQIHQPNQGNVLGPVEEFDDENGTLMTEDRHLLYNLDKAVYLGCVNKVVEELKGVARKKNIVI